jgi:hypothetical protein
MAESRPNYDSYSGPENKGRNGTLRTPFDASILTNSTPPPPVLGKPELSTSKNLGKQKGHAQKHTHY